jgi:hypothetical protein
MATPKGFEQRVWFLPAAADLEGITVAEFTAGDEITADLPSPISFAGTTNYIDTSDISSQQDKQEAGTLSIDSLDFEVYRRNPTTDEVAIPVLINGSEGVLVKFEGGGLAGASPAAGDDYDAVEVTIGTKSDVSTGRNETRRMTVPMAVSGEIVRAGTVAA